MLPFRNITILDMKPETFITKTMKHTITELISSYDTPFYVYDSKQIRDNCRQFLSIPYPHKSIHFAVMANDSPEFLKIIKEEHINVFVNSVDHLKKCRETGFRGNEIIFTASAMNAALMKLIHDSNVIVNLDSVGQIKLWTSLFPDALFGIRCNIGALVQPRKTRGGYFIGPESRLGLTLPELDQIKKVRNIAGLHIYIGTDIIDIDYYKTCYTHLIHITSDFPDITYLDFGGGFSISDADASRGFDMKTYGAMVSELMEDLSRKRDRPVTLILEPGRILGGKAGYFVCRVVDIKYRKDIQLAGVDASSVQFPRPLFYPDSAFHPVTVLNNTVHHNEKEYITSIFGCSTYSRDFLARKIMLPELHVDDVIIFGYAGSYCAASYTTFLGFQKAGEYFI